MLRRSLPSSKKIFMKRLFYCCVLLLLFSGCKKKSTDKIEIYMLQSFVVRTEPATSPPTITITNAVLSTTPLVADNEIEFYTKSTTTFKLKTDIKPIIQNYSTDKGFAVVVNGQPVYYGQFHPAYLSSISFGIATIDPTLFSNNELKIDFPTITGNATLQQYDKRNDPLLINALSASGRLR